MKTILKVTRPAGFVRFYTSGKDVLKFYTHENEDVPKNPWTEFDFSRFISKRAALREPALTRQITSLAYKVDKEFISLAEGMPNEQVFPFEKISIQMKSGETVMLQGPRLATALQYIPSQGLPSLLDELRSFQKELHRPPHWADRDVLVTTGSQDGLYKCVDLVLEPGDPVLVPLPTYNGIDIVLKPYRPEALGIPEDEDGVIPEALESLLKERSSLGLKLPKLMYLVPTGCNPSGSVVPEARKRKLYEIARRYDFIIVEDDAYMFLNYHQQVPSFLSMDVDGRVLRLDSFSKVLSSGMRLGWVTAPRPLLHRLELHMQASHLHAATFTQMILCELLQTWGREGFVRHIEQVREFYRCRRDALHLSLTEHLSDLAEWSLPKGGLFIWIKIKDVDDVFSLVHKAFEQGLMLIPGQACMLNAKAPCQFLRLTFSRIKMEDMDTAARHLAALIREEKSRCRQQLATQS